ncbi:recombinase family protein [Halobacillus karajensis]|uniref:recombinase family protein n=1 Tax=Halobacillus karajensis TaxID=195088 RepID=UPI00045D0AD1|nr:recombinase family protein [Halobacillus karajensis]CDQ17981.1 DNA-invertase hin [Halobacillus karajensis]
MTIGIYIRVSTLEQAKEGYSISAQKERLMAFCSAQGWENYKFYVDEGVSGKDTKRPQLQSLMEDMEEGNLEMILVYRLDRFTRSVLDLHKMLELMDKHNCVFKSATEPYDTSTAMGRMFITIVAAMAQWEIENSSERIKMALEEKVAEGQRVGNVPYGFDLTSEEKLIANDKAPVVLDIIDKIKSGWSATSVAEFLNKTNNDRVWRPTTVLRVLKNPALYGATRWNDKLYEDTHEGLITKSDFMKIQQMLDDRSIHHRRNVKNEYLFQGVLSCPTCDRFLSVNRYIRKRRDGTEYQGAIYRCQDCRKKKGKFNKSPGENRFLDALYRYMKSIKIDHLDSAAPEENKNDMIKSQLQQIERKREKYQRAWASDLMDDDEFKKLMDETKEPYEDLKKKLSETDQPALIDKDKVKEIIFTFNENFELLTQEEKKAFISSFVRRIDFKVIPQPPKDPAKTKSKYGKDLIEITEVVFY